ncbi:MAG: two-component regulator propeller domain-containing protein [Rhodothermales bacterium]
MMGVWSKIVFVAVALILVVFPESSQAQRYHFVSYTIDDGLAQSQPKAILESSTGYLWVGTFGGGVSRFDGRSFTNFTTKDGLASNDVNAIVEDQDGRIWFATNQGISWYDGTQFHTLEMEDEGPSVNDLVVEPSGTLWFGTSKQGLGRYDGTALTFFSTDDGLLDPFVQVLYLDRAGTLWVGTDGGLCRREEATFTCYTIADGLSDPYVRALAEDEQGRLWVAARRGVTFFDGQTFTPFRQDIFEDTFVGAVLVDGDGSVWLGTDQGLFRSFREFFISYRKENGLPNSNILSLHEDREGNIWIGSNAGGLTRYSASPFVLFDTQHGLEDASIWTILEDRDKNLWFGTNSFGVARYDGRSFTHFTTADGLVGLQVYASLMDRTGMLWFGTDNGVSRYDGSRFYALTNTGIQGEIWTLEEDRNGALWIGSAAEGVVRYEKGRFTQFTTDEGLADNTILKIHEDRNGFVWLGTNNGVTRYDGHEMASITKANDLNLGPVGALQDDWDGHLWIGTYGQGLFHYIPGVSGTTGAFHRVTMEDGLSDEYILSMVFDSQGDLWICTNNGLNKLDVARFKVSGDIDIASYGSAEGFIGRECNAGAGSLDSNGDLWFGTVKGITRYAPGHERANPHEPRTHITNVRLFFEEQGLFDYADGIDVGTGLPVNLRLPYNKSHLTFDFVGISMKVPENVSYQYQLEGLDETWTPVTQETHATYANLSSGVYTFKVKAANSDGVWNAEPASFHFEITPPFWLTPWFIFLSILFLAFNAYGFLRTRERKLKRRQQYLEEMVEERTRALRREKERVVQVNAKLAHTNLELKQLSLVARETDNAVFILDADGRLEWANEGFMRMTGYTLDTLKQARGETVQEVSSSPDIAEMFRRAVEDKVSILYEAPFTTIDGRDLWLASTMSPITAEDGTVRKVVVVDTDITEHKALEAELIDAREAALEAVRVKSEFLANMSHEIRTPMNGVIGMTSLLLDTNLAAEQKEFVQVIRTSGEALLAIINDILDFSKIEAGKIELEEQAFDLHTVIEEALDLVARKATEKQLELAYFVDEAVPPTVQGDVTRVRQVLTNLLSNAVKFTPEGEITVSVAAQPVEASLYEIHFAVRDTGIGIPADRMNRLFESFSQVDTSTTRKYGGTGLGLAISKRLSELMGGTMWVESEVDVGSTFHFSICVPSVSDAERMKVADKKVHLRGKRLLIVDDNATNRRMLTIQTQRWGMEVYEVTSGMEALAWFDQGHTCDVAILDMQMPEMDGLMLARKMAAQKSTALLPLVMLSSMGKRSSLEGTRLTAWLTKPAKKNQLFDTLVRALAPEASTTTASEAGVSIDSGMARELPLRILLAEDNVVNQKVLQQFLMRLGYRADVVANGFEVLDALERSRYDVVLMDVQMPEMDGLEATRRIRTTREPSDWPWIIAITANATLEDQQQCYDAGMDDYLSKPVRIDDLVKALQQSMPHTADDGEETEEGDEAATVPSVQETTPPTVFSLDKLHDTVGDDDPEFIEDVLRTYLENTPTLIADLQQAVCNGNAVALYRAAHPLKSSSKMIGADAFAALCEIIEQLGRDEKLSEAASLVAEVDPQFGAARSAIERYLRTGDAATDPPPRMRPYPGLPSSA